jgi:hypothetical protein
MTEAEWLACDDPAEMLRFIKGRRAMRKRVKQRKQRLFAVACCRRLRPLLDDERSRRGIEVVEAFADGQATIEELRMTEAEATAIWSKSAASDEEFAYMQLCAHMQLCADEVTGLSVSTWAIGAAFEQRKRETNESFEPRDGRRRRRRGGWPTEERAHCALIRDIFGNPFRPVAFAPSWRTTDAVGLARAVYDSRDFAAMPILADALEDAGCDSEAILAHCRGDGPHARGCWVVDSLLGKE